MRFSISLLSLAFLIVFLSACNDNDEDPVAGSETTVTIEGDIYQTVKIGTQTWTSINYAGPGGASYDAENSKPEYGKYYSNAELSAIKLPEGWRIPTQQDFTKLAESCGITLPSNGTNTDLVKTIISETNWNNVVGTNTSGFNAHPAGYIFGTSAPMDGDISEFWATEGITLSIQEAGLNLTSLRMIFMKSDNSPDFKFNVRFVKDE